MPANSERVVLITGASSGIGRACASYLARRGYRVYGTSRRARWEARESEGTRAQPGSFELIPMDVTEDASVARAVEAILSREGRLDVVLNNAGIAFAGAVEDTSLEEARAQLETNFFGALRVCHVVIPPMRRQGAGYIVNVSSVGGVIGIPFQGVYSASKFALEGLSETLRLEVQPYGIRVVLVEPGDLRTEITVHRRKTRASQQDSPYAERLARSLAVMEVDETKGAPPEIVAHLLERIINTPSPRLRYTVGPAIEKLAIAVKRVVPYRVFEWVLMKYYGLL